MLYKIIKSQKDRWFSSDDCSIRDTIHYIKAKDKLRQTQIEAIEIYLYLKIKGENKPLWQLFSEGFFLEKIDSNDLVAKYLLEKQETQKLSLYQFAKQELPALAKHINDNKISNEECQRIIKQIFYSVDYSDYLLSLPMGAGKTFLMASFIYLDLYFALNEPPK